MATPDQRLKMLTLMTMTLAAKQKIHYGQTRPMQTNRIASVQALRNLLQSYLGITMDCSEGITLICRLAGLKDPNGENYNGQGNTGMLLHNPNLPHYQDPKHADIGALVVFGSGYGKHVAMVHTKDPVNPFLWSHGTESGPKLVAFSAEHKYFENVPFTFLSIEHL